LGAGTFSWPEAINDRGQIIGHCGRDANDFVWREGRITDLGSFASAAINDRGQIAGNIGDRAYLWERGRLIALGTLRGKFGKSTVPVAINDQGEVTGNVYGADVYDDSRAFLWQDGRMIDLGTLGGKSSWATAINDRSQISGESGND